MNALARVAGTVFAAAMACACHPANRFPGNDREAAAAAPKAAAARVEPSVLVAAVAPGSIQPEAMAPQDLATLAQRPPCSFHLRREDAPAVAYGAHGATIKVDGRLVALPAAGAGHFAAGGIDLRILADGRNRGADANADMVLKVRRAADERGYRGWARCAS